MFRPKPKHWRGNRQPRVNRSHPLASSLLWGLFPYGNSVFSIDDSAQDSPAVVTGDANVTTQPEVADPRFNANPVIEISEISSPTTDGVDIEASDDRLRLSSSLGDTHWIALRYVAYNQVANFRRILDGSSGGSGAGGYSIYINANDGSEPTVRRNGRTTVQLSILSPDSPRYIWYDLLYHPLSSSLDADAYLRLNENVDSVIGEWAAQATGQPTTGLLNSSSSWSQAHALRGAVAYACAFRTPNNTPHDAVQALWDDFRFDPYGLISPPVFVLAAPGPPGVNLTATLAGDSSVSATLTVEPAPADINLDATLPGDSSVGATLTIEPSPTEALTATLPGDSSIDATLSVVVGGEVALDATLDGDSSLNATLTVEPSPTEALSATLPGDSSIDATLTVTPSPTQALTATLDGDSSITATLVSEAPDVRQLVATLSGEADITATLTLEPSTPVDLDATLDGDSSIFALLSVEAPGMKQLVAGLPGDSSVDATLTLQPSQEVALSATLAGDSDINATLTVQPEVVVPLSATLDGGSSITATLAVQAPGEILVSARLQADSAIVATLTTVVEGLPIICDPSIESCTPVRTVEGTGSSGVT